MRKIILAAAAFLLIPSTNSGSYAQNTEKKEAEKTQQTTTVDAWRDAIPLSEQPYYKPPAVAADESTDSVESEESAAQIEKRILDLERRLMEALKARDSVMLKHLLADDFMPVGENVVGAQPADKNRFIDWALKNLELKSYNLEKTTVRVYPTTAVVTIQYKRQANIAGAPSDGDFIVTNVWVKREKRWQAVSHHVSRLSKP